MLLRYVEGIQLQVVLYVVVQSSAYTVASHAPHQCLLALGERHEVEV